MLAATMTEDDWKALDGNLKDPIWRIRNLYKIKASKGGKLIPFVPSPEQQQIIDAIYLDGLTKILILKARQLGMSTVIDVIMADMMIWNEGHQGSIVDQTQKDSALKLKHKVAAAFYSMPEAIRDLFVVVKSNDSEFAVRFRKADDDQVSTTFAGTNARGGTNNVLHVSEWGPIQHDDPPRSEEIMTGALPSAEDGLTVVETTWKGGKGGDLWEITDRAMTTRPEDMTDKDYTLFFFPWYKDPRYQTEGNFAQIPAELHKYFDECERHLAALKTPHKFSPQQRLWYYKVAMPKGAARYAEYPTVLEECFKAPVPGAIYAELIDQARAEGRIIDFPWDRSSLVFTFWDLGSPKNTEVIFLQFVGRELHVIDHDTGLDLGPTERVAHLKAKGYPYGGHLFPHDAGAKEKSGKNFEEQMTDAGLTSISIIPRCPEVWPGINKMGELLPRMLFHKTRCKKLIEALSCYRTKEDKTKAGHQTSQPVHDWASHPADAFRMIGEAMDAGLVNRTASPSGVVISPIAGLGGKPQKGSRVISPLD